jgi:hypothetical protein
MEIDPPLPDLMTETIMSSTRLNAFSGRGLMAALATAVLAIAAVQYTPAAEARSFSGGHAAGHFAGGGGHFAGRGRFFGPRFGGALLGGAIIGGALASSYYYGGYYPPYGYPPAYYPPAGYPADPSGYIEQPYGSDGPQAAASYGSVAPPYNGAAPQGYASQQGVPQDQQLYAGGQPGPQDQGQQMSVEQRAQRLQAMCNQHLFTPQECAARRQQLMQEM